MLNLKKGAEIEFLANWETGTLTRKKISRVLFDVKTLV